MKTYKELMLMIEKTQISVYQRTGQRWFLRKTMNFLREIGAITDKEHEQIIIHLGLEV